MCKKLKIVIIPDDAVSDDDISIIRKIFKKNLDKYKEAGFEVE